MPKITANDTTTTARILYRDVPRELIGLHGTFGPFFVAEIIGNGFAPYKKAGAVVLVEQCDDVNDYEMHMFSEPGSDNLVLAYAEPKGKDAFEVALWRGAPRRVSIMGRRITTYPSTLSSPPADLPPVRGIVHCEVAARYFHLKRLVEWIRQQSPTRVAA